MTAELAAAVAAYRLPGARRGLPEKALDLGQWSRFFGIVCEQRLTGLLVAAVDDGAFPTTVAQAEQAAAAQVESMHLALVLEQLLVRLVDGLDGADVDYRVLKGPAYARLVYPDPALRPFGDIDILVPGDQLDLAATVLKTTGAWRPVPELRPGFDRRFGKGATFRTAAGHEIDLHRTFIFGPFGMRMRAGDLFISADPFVVGGRTMKTLTAEGRFVHACFHALLGSPQPRLLPMRDIAQIASTTSFDLGAATELARSWRAEAVVATAVRTAWRILSIDEVVEVSAWADRYEVTRKERQALSVYGHGSSYLTQAAASLGSIHGLREKGAFMASLALSPVARRPGLPRRARRIWDGVRVLLPGSGRS